MANLQINLGGIISPNPFWLASAPPTNSGYQVQKAFDAGWGGAVWKTLGEPIINVSSRFAGFNYLGNKIAGLSHIELITDRPLEINLKEIKQTKKLFPKQPIIASLMVEPAREKWHEIVKKVESVGVDGLELNFGCSYGMGAASGKLPDLVRLQTEWVKEVAQTPIIVKLSPNITDIRFTARAAREGGADSISLINTINSLMGVNIETEEPIPSVNGKGTRGGYGGPAVKPIALGMVADCSSDSLVGIPLSGIGGISNWKDAVEFLLMGATGVQVCTAVMHHGFKIIEKMIKGLNNYLDEKGYDSVMDIVGRSVPRYGSWGDLDLNYKVVAKINQEKCINCNKCYVACDDAAHQSILKIKKEGTKKDRLIVNENSCTGCNLCALVCPVEGALDMVEVPAVENPVTWNEIQAFI